MKNTIVIICFCMTLFSCNQGKIQNVILKGELVAKTILQVSYNCSGLETVPKITWSVADSKDGEWTELPGIHSAEIVLLTDYVGKFLKCEIMPVQEDGSNGKPVSVVTGSPVVYQGNPNTDWFKEAGVGVMLHFLKDILPKTAVQKSGTMQLINLMLNCLQMAAKWPVPVM